MAVSKRAPNTILLGGGLPGGDGGHTIVNEFIAGVEITPGMLIEFYGDTGKAKLRPHASADEQPTPMVALEKAMHNKGVDDVYAVGDLVHAAHLRKGSTFWGLLPSGQNIQAGESLQSNGNGMLKVAGATTAGANVAQFQSLDEIGAITVTTRCRVLVV